MRTADTSATVRRLAALGRADDSRYGLAAYLHTADQDRVLRLSAGLGAGTVVVNGAGRISAVAPFGGYEASGFGREGGRAGMGEMVRRKTC